MGGSVETEKELEKNKDDDLLMNSFLEIKVNPIQKIWVDQPQYHLKINLVDETHRFLR